MALRENIFVLPIDFLPNGRPLFLFDSMRMEKGYGYWKADYITEFNPIGPGLDRFVDMDKDFPGKAGLQVQVSAGNRKQRVILELDSTKASAQPGEGIFLGGKSVGSITSAAWGYRTQKNLAMAYITPEYAVENSELEVLLLGDTVKATVCKSCLYDSGNLIPRGLS
jgi:dimethylglycine dehydrogenase